MNAFAGTSGFYTVSQAARLVRVNNAKLRGWVFGYSGTNGPPIISNEVAAIGKRQVLSFGSLVESRLIRQFTDWGLHLNTLRVIADEARQLIDHPHPFATMKFRTDGRKVFAQVADRDLDDPKLYDLLKKNWTMYKILEPTLLKGAEYNSEEVRAWKPDPSLDVTLDPKISFGQPSLTTSRIPVEAIKNAFDAEDESIESVAKQFGITRDEVRYALEFQYKYAA